MDSKYGLVWLGVAAMWAKFSCARNRLITGTSVKHAEIYTKVLNTELDEP